MGDRLTAVVVDYDAGGLLAECVRSLHDDDVSHVVVVENGDAEIARGVLGDLSVPLVVTGRNIGFGAGANRGIAVSGDSPYVLVCNADLRVHPGAARALVASLDAHPDWAIVGPRILEPSGIDYPSVRRFPSMVDAAGHALLALFWPGNPFSRRYRGEEDDPGSRSVDWVSGACFCARRDALDELGGFDESYFMFAEDIDLCWRAHEAGWAVGVEPAAVVTHVQGVSRRRHPYRMILAHHRSALRFATRRAHGAETLALPAAAAVLGVRLVMAVADEARRRRGASPARRVAGEGTLRYRLPRRGGGPASAGNRQESGHGPGSSR